MTRFSSRTPLPVCVLRALCSVYCPFSAVLTKLICSHLLPLLFLVHTLRDILVRQTKRGWFQEILGCQAKSEFRYFIADNQVAQSLEDADCCCRICCAPIHPFKMRVQELSTDAELLAVDRPLRCCQMACKCCCFQEISVASGGAALGTVMETSYCCIPTFKVFDPAGEELYLIHPPTCCGGMCMNCCTEGNPCGKGCCKVPFWIFNAGQANTGGDAAHIGKILKKPKSLLVEVFTDANAFTIDFPEQASADEKALLVGTSIFFNAMFFEGGE
jgi:hypothetical protein